MADLGDCHRMTRRHRRSRCWSGTILLAVASLVNLLSSADGRYIPEFDRPLTNMTVTLGHEAVFTCHVSHLGGYKVGWIKSDTKAIQAIHTHVITHNPRVSVRHHGLAVWQLVLSDVQREDEGAYMCQINTDPMKSQVAYLRVVVPPEIEPDTSNEVMVPEGSSLKLSCKSKGIPNPIVRWQRKDGEEINIRAPNGERIRYSVYEGEVLRFSKISRLDMGVYVCTASNGVPPAASRNIMVNVHFSPVVHVPNQLIWSSVGSNLTMECFIEASPRSMNFWVKGPGELILSGTKYTLSDVRDSIFAGRMALTIHSFQKADVGMYRCVAKNSLGEVEGRIQVYESRHQTNPVPKQRFDDDDDDDGDDDVEDDDGDGQVVTEPQTAWTSTAGPAAGAATSQVQHEAAPWHNSSRAHGRSSATPLSPTRLSLLSLLSLSVVLAL